MKLMEQNCRLSVTGLNQEAFDLSLAMTGHEYPVLASAVQHERSYDVLEPVPEAPTFAVAAAVGAAAVAAAGPSITIAPDLQLAAFELPWSTFHGDPTPVFPAASQVG